jgi:hypothetical protein
MGGAVTEQQLCGARAVFWPDVEACDAECVLPSGHQPQDVHEDATLGTWTEDDLYTEHPEEPAG